QACLQVTCDYGDYVTVKGTKYFKRPKHGSIADPYPYLLKEKYKKGFDFIAIGDWGQRGKGTGQLQVADGMAAWADKNKPDFILNLGDSFYQTNTSLPVTNPNDHEGVSNITDPKWKSYWLDAYGGNLKKVPWYSVAGNHDWYNNVTAEVAYFWDVDWRFFLPSLYYTRKVYFGPKNKCAVFIHIDTDPFFYNYTSYNNTNNLKSTLLKLNLNEPDEIQHKLNWVESELIKAKDADWIFVVGHHPLVGDCRLKNPAYYLMYLFPPIFKKYNVSAYFNGHAHDLSYSEANSTSPTSYFGSGGGGAVLGAGCANSTWATPYTFGFLHAKMSDDGESLSFDFVATNKTDAPPTILKSGKIYSRKHKP
ncbi:17947_t:CDS:2, partial [Acaulospora morrowiae]